MPRCGGLSQPALQVRIRSKKPSPMGRVPRRGGRGDAISHMLPCRNVSAGS